MKKTYLIVIITLIVIRPSFAQNSEIKLNLDNEGSKYIKATFLNQTWVRMNQSNPGTMVNGAIMEQTLDIGLRRTRMQLFGQISDRAFFYTQFGMNNFNFLSQNAGNRKLQAFFHDALGEYMVFEDQNYLKLGGGLTITNGLSRFSQPSIGTIMTLDVPVFAQATVDQTDEFSRKLSLYARGQLGKFDYRVALSDPFPVTTSGAPPVAISEYATFSRKGHSKQFQGFFIYNLWDSEPHTTPYMTGTYLGKRRVLNLETGFISQPRATWSASETDTAYHDMLHWSVAAYLDTPVKENGSALSAYLGYFNTNYGPGYIRNNGLMNPANGVSNQASFNGAGNAYPMFGTGTVLYFQLGYKLADNLLGDEGTLMPFFSINNAHYERLSDPVTVYDIGLNWLMQGHSSKLSIDYQRRPVFTENAPGNMAATATRGSLILQYQISF